MIILSLGKDEVSQKLFAQSPENKQGVLPLKKPAINFYHMDFQSNDLMEINSSILNMHHIPERKAEYINHIKKDNDIYTYKDREDPFIEKNNFSNIDFLIIGLKNDLRVRHFTLQKESILTHFWTVEDAISFYRQYIRLFKMSFTHQMDYYDFKIDSFNHKASKSDHEKISTEKLNFSELNLETKCTQYNTKSKAIPYPTEIECLPQTTFCKHVDSLLDSRFHCKNNNSRFADNEEIKNRSRSLEKVVSVIFNCNNSSEKQHPKENSNCLIDDWSEANKEFYEYKISEMEDSSDIDRISYKHVIKFQEVKQENTEIMSLMDTKNETQAMEHSELSVAELSIEERKILFLERVKYFNKMKNNFSKNDLKKMSSSYEEGRLSFLFLNSKEVSCGCLSNILMQNAIKAFDESQLCEIIKNLGTDIAPISATKYGAYTVQTIILCATSKPSQQLLSKYFEQHGEFLITHEIGNYTIQKILRFDEDLVYNLCMQGLVEIMNNPLGVKVFRRCLEFFKERDAEIIQYVKMVETLENSEKCKSIIQFLENDQK